MSNITKMKEVSKKEFFEYIFSLDFDVISVRAHEAVSWPYPKNFKKWYSPEVVGKIVPILDENGCSKYPHYSKYFIKV